MAVGFGEMAVLKVLRARPELFFRLSGIRLADFDALVFELRPIWLAQEKRRLSRANRQRAIGGGRKFRLQLAEQLLLCLIYYRTYASQAFVGLLFDTSILGLINTLRGPPAQPVSA